MFKSSVVLAITVLAASAATAQAQTEENQPSRWQFIVSSGSMVPTGAQRDAIKRGSLTNAQLSYAIHPAVAITASFGWARTRDVTSVGTPKLDMFTYDVGTEVRANRWLSGKMLSFSPFAGVGAGGRSYNYRSLDVDASHNAAVYASAGGELGVGRRVKVRLEARDYVTGFKPLTGSGDSDTRNDVAVLAGLRIKVR
jgi:hypothetical protein